MPNAEKMHPILTTKNKNWQKKVKNALQDTFIAILKSSYK